jgi:hypothetical protein
MYRVEADMPCRGSIVPVEGSVVPDSYAIFLTIAFSSSNGFQLSFELKHRPT